jgi:hypothetical protein
LVLIISFPTIGRAKKPLPKLKKGTILQPTNYANLTSAALVESGFGLLLQTEESNL